MKKSNINKLFVCNVIVIMFIIILFCFCKMLGGRNGQEMKQTEYVETKEKTRLLNWKTKEDEEGIFMNYLNTTSEYAQIYENNYYFLRYKGNNSYTIYMNKGQKAGTFLLEEGTELLGFVKSGEYFFIKYQRDGEHIVNLAKINLKKNSLEPIYSLSYLTFHELPTDYFFNDSIYSVKENVMNDRAEYGIICRNLNGIVVNEYNVTFSNKTHNPYQIIKMTKEEILFEKIEMSKRAFYVYNMEKKKCKRVTQLAFPDDKEINNNEGQYSFEQDILVAMLPMKSKDSLFRLYSMNYNDEKVELLTDEIREFCCYGRYICYIDKNYAVHKYDRKKELDTILDSKLKVISLNCTNAGVWMREYDKLCAEESEDIFKSHSDPLYYMNYEGSKMEIREKNG